MNAVVMTALAASAAPLLAVGYAAGRLRSRRLLRDARRALAAESRAARSDALTGLANRTGLLEGLERRVASGEPFALAFVDLDGFKAVNDTHGHDTGDLLLIAVAQHLAALAGDSGVAARLGGDEFVVVRAASSLAAARLLGYDVVRRINRTVEVDGRRIEVRASVGVAHGTRGDSIPALLHCADVAMYLAKRGRARGEGRVAEHDEDGLVEERPGTRLRELSQLGLNLFEVAA